MKYPANVVLSIAIAGLISGASLSGLFFVFLPHAHHKLSYAEYPKLRYRVSNGETLCVDCHADEHPEIAYFIKSTRTKNMRRSVAA